MGVSDRERYLWVELDSPGPPRPPKSACAMVGRNWSGTPLLLLGAGALRDDPEGVVDAVHALDRGQHVGEVGDVGQLEGEAKGGDPVAPGGDRGRHDVDVVVRKDLGDVAEQLGAVQR